MKNLAKNGRVLWAVALLAIPSAAYAQDNASTATNGATAVPGNAAGDPAMTDSMTTTTVPSDTMNNGAPMGDAVASDMALANTVQPERDDDDDFPWGLLGLAGLAGLLGRKRDDHHVNTQAGRRDL